MATNSRKTCTVEMISSDKHFCTYIAVAEFTLFIAGTDHRVVNGIVVPGRLIAGVTIDQWKHCLHQFVRYITVSCQPQQLISINWESQLLSTCTGIMEK